MGTNLDLHSFAAFFEIMGAINLGFAGSEKFRRSINEQLLDGKSAISEKSLSRLRARVETLRKVDGDTEILAGEISGSNKLKLISIEGAIKNIIDNYTERLEKLDGEFKPIFSISGIYCIYLLLLEGFHQFYITDETHHVVCTNISWSWILLIIIGLIFLKSFTRLHKYPIQFIYIIFLLLIFFLITMLLTVNNMGFLPLKHHYTEERTTITYAVILALSPYLLYTFRYYFEKKIASKINIFKFKLGCYIATHIVLYQHETAIDSITPKHLADQLNNNFIDDTKLYLKKITYKLSLRLYHFLTRSFK